MDLTFNVIFSAEEVRYLRLAVLSLLEFSPYRYRLVANGLGQEEHRLLKKFVASDQRLDLFVCPNERKLAHGKILDLLEQMNNNEY